MRTGSLSAASFRICRNCAAVLSEQSATAASLSNSVGSPQPDAILDSGEDGPFEGLKVYMGSIYQSTASIIIHWNFKGNFFFGFEKYLL